MSTSIVHVVSFQSTSTGGFKIIDQVLALIVRTVGITVLVYCDQITQNVDANFLKLDFYLRIVLAENSVVISIAVLKMLRNVFEQIDQIWIVFQIKY